MEGHTQARPLVAAWRQRHPTSRTAGWIRLVAPALALVAALLYLLLAVRADAPAEGEYRYEILVARHGLVALFALGAVVSWRFGILGASVMAFAAAVLGSLHASDHSPSSAFAVTVVFLVPAVGLWVDWQRRRPAAPVVVVAGVFAVAFLGAGWGADRVNAHFYGPTHPDSYAAIEPVDVIEWSWVGAVGVDGATVTARLAADAGQVRLVVATDGGFTDPLAGTPVAVTADDAGVVRLVITGLEPATTYRFAIEVDGHLDRGRRGSFTTIPDGPASFSFALASCARVGTNGAVFDAIRDAQPLFFLVTGDLHYTNIATRDVDKFADAFDTLLEAPGPSLLFRRVPVDYVWDDHDFGGNDSDSTSAAAPAAQEAYRRLVPSYDLPATDSIEHAFTVGRVRFVATDTRSHRTPADEPDGEGKTMLGAEQLAWLFDQFDAAAAAGEFVVWIQPDPWIAEPTDGADHWGGYSTERRRIADHIAALGLADRLLMVSGDAHMLAFDDGTNSDYSTDGGAGFAVFHAAALDRPGMTKGGPYSGGAVPGGGQFGLVHVEDHGDHLTLRLEGRRWNGEIVLDHTLVVPMPSEVGDAS
ncbi:MAG: alkaline phosphatase D family protein [Acidimicrobiales bacterium]|nr:alkaline phosphatase D family protein [Acidimicrobiales bacterium]